MIPPNSVKLCQRWLASAPPGREVNFVPTPSPTITVNSNLLMLEERLTCLQKELCTLFDQLNLAIIQSAPSPSVAQSTGNSSSGVPLADYVDTLHVRTQQMIDQTRDMQSRVRVN